MALQTKKANPNRPVRAMIYGLEGVGKSSLGARSDNPIFISPEGGADQLKKADGSLVDEAVGVNSWETLIATVKDLIKEKHDFKTVVLDSADWIEGLAHSKIIGNSGKTIVTANGGYGSGYRQSQNMHQDLISLLSELRDKRDMNIILTAHAHVKAVKDPEMMSDYDAFEIKCHELVSALWREWVDALFFVRFRTFTKTNEDASKARALSDGTRVVYTEKRPAFQAKNRYGMPAELPFTLDFWNELMKYARLGPKAETAEEIRNQIDDLINRVSDEAIRNGATKSVFDAGENLGQLKVIRGRLMEITGMKNG